jgi:hypothetical protein
MHAGNAPSHASPYTRTCAYVCMRVMFFFFLCVKRPRRKAKRRRWPLKQRGEVPIRTIEILLPHNCFLSHRPGLRTYPLLPTATTRVLALARQPTQTAHPTTLRSKLYCHCHGTAKHIKLRKYGRFDLNSVREQALQPSPRLAVAVLFGSWVAENACEAHHHLDVSFVPLLERALLVVL